MSEVFAKQQNTIAQNIIKLIQKHPSAAYDYRKLDQYYHYYIDGLDEFIPLQKLENCTQPESINRAFRKLVEEGKIELPKEFKESRNQQEKRFRDFYGKKRVKA